MSGEPRRANTPGRISRVFGNSLVQLTLLLLLLGLAVAIAWLRAAESWRGLASVRGGRPLFLPLLAVLTGASIGVRFVRWQFLLRRIQVRIPARSSLRAYVASLAGIATPAHVGEIARSVLLRRRHGVPIRRTLPVIVGERLADAVVLGVVAAFVIPPARTPVLIILLVVIAVLVAGLLAWLFREVPVMGGAIRRLSRPGAVLPALLMSVIAWIPACALAGLAAVAVGTPVSWPRSMALFARATLWGGATLMPAGVGTTGSVAIVGLGELGMALPQAVAAVTVLRAGTVGVTLLLGIGALLLELRAKPAPAARDAALHFEEIADTYENSFSAHMLELLVHRKVRMLERGLEGLEPARRGLDLGCGQGFHLDPMSGVGRSIVGVDPALRAIRRAQSRSKNVLAGDGLSLPFRDAAFDFVYAIGVMHHVIGDSRELILGEVERVLRPGGRFLLHETNPRNPLFRFYMSYLFPIIKQIDEGTEEWLDPEDTEVAGMRRIGVHYATFLPDFTPEALLPLLRPAERRLEASRWRDQSAHYLAVYEKPTDGAR